MAGVDRTRKTWLDFNAHFAFEGKQYGHHSRGVSKESVKEDQRLGWMLVFSLFSYPGAWSVRVSAHVRDFNSPTRDAGTACTTATPTPTILRKLRESGGECEDRELESRIE
jgi:hypothetical protein